MLMYIPVLIFIVLVVVALTVTYLILKRKNKGFRFKWLCKVNIFISIATIIIYYLSFLITQGEAIAMYIFLGILAIVNGVFLYQTKRRIDVTKLQDAKDLSEFVETIKIILDKQEKLAIKVEEISSSKINFKQQLKQEFKDNPNIKNEIKFDKLINQIDKIYGDFQKLETNYNNILDMHKQINARFSKNEEMIEKLSFIKTEQDIISNQLNELRNSSNQLTKYYNQLTKITEDLESNKIKNLFNEQESINKKIDDLNKYCEKLDNVTHELEKHRIAQVKWEELDEDRQKQYVNVAMRKYYSSQLADDRFEISRQQKALMRESLESGEFFIEDLSADEQKKIQKSAKNIYENQEFEKYNSVSVSNSKKTENTTKKNKLKLALIIIPCVWLGLLIIGMIIPSMLSLDAQINFSMIWSIIFWFITTPITWIVEVVLLYIRFFKNKNKMQAFVDLYISKNKK